MQKLYFTLKQKLYHTDIPDHYDLDSDYYWIKILKDITPIINIHRDYFTVVTKQPYKQTSYTNKIHHYIIDDEIQWPYHFFHLFNHKSHQMYNLIPDKIKKKRVFETLYKREIHKPYQLRESKYIKYNEINKLRNMYI